MNYVEAVQLTFRPVHRMGSGPNGLSADIASSLSVAPLRECRLLVQRAAQNPRSSGQDAVKWIAEPSKAWQGNTNDKPPQTP